MLDFAIVLLLLFDCRVFIASTRITPVGYRIPLKVQYLMMSSIFSRLLIFIKSIKYSV